MGAYRQMEESRNKTNNILMGAMGHQGNTENNLYMNQAKMTQGSYNMQSGNQ